MLTRAWRWALGLFFIILVATIWIAASYIVQSVVDSGVSPFLITYICNSLFIIYIPIIEIGRYLERSIGKSGFGHGDEENLHSSDSKASEKTILLDKNSSNSGVHDNLARLSESSSEKELPDDAIESLMVKAEAQELDNAIELKPLVKPRLNRCGVAKISLLISPFWFLAQLTFNISLKYTTVTSNTILSSASSLFTFLVALGFLGEVFTWVKLFSVLLCMAGTVIVSLGDSGSETSVATNPVLGDLLALLSSAFYAIYITLIRKKIPDEDKGEFQVSMAEFLGYLGFFNLLIFFPVALVLNFTGWEPFHDLSLKQVGLIVGKGLLDNVLSDYLWAKAVLLTTTTVATAGLTIQVPLAAVVDSLTGNAPHLLDYIGGGAIMFGFVGINLPSNICGTSTPTEQENAETGNAQGIDVS
ncbi:uncharacterized vacuolar membrane protein YML018C [Nymphaea colorata]|nr:uncharacterized vacuolar membrane protein YML018C [Nymphaea colorata]XP_031503316.1 uncharacterized vacuolar membrane protein YML018C [Nymphaea colorata]XP_031503317.1 uncharacterized vacuolar membrane protein YML018C [Nymphaea colorata]XP_031503318.1 uncharacterized vacuolar membrane protein YML018C [Nymphaea colorata]